ncbi:MAG TPA: Rossmann-like and DUF2520 domain-containing protein [Gemmatimonadales bacterium]|nr:Rossmann-like and DUF2520 domain-containing protein [Gemmatimonadales bacterium]
MLNPAVAIVGAGRMGQGLALGLLPAGHRVALLSRAPHPVARPLRQAVEPWGTVIPAADLVILAVPDDVITRVAGRLATGHGLSPRHVVLHLSGRLDATALEPLRATGAALGSFHPLQTVADPVLAPSRLRGAHAALEGDPSAVTAGRALATSLGLHPVVIGGTGKALYHAGAVMVANYTVTLMGVAERLARQAGVPGSLAERMYLPLLRGALENLEDLGPVRSLTGPVRRGDDGTVRAHLAALPAADAELYAVLGRAALELAREAGLGEARVRAVGRALGGDGTAEPGG